MPTPRPRAALEEVVAAGLLTLVGLAGISGGVSLGLWANGQPGAGLMPALSGAAVALAAGTLTVTALLSPRRTSPALAPAGHRKPLVVLLLMAGYITLLPALGYVPMTAAFLLVLMWLVERMAPRVSLLVSVGATIVLYVVFGTLLRLPLRPWPAWIF